MEDDWRRSRQTAVANVVGGSPASAGAADPDAVPGDLRKSSTDIAAGNYRQSLLQNLPLTPVLMAQSNTRTYNAYLEIANFYRDVLEDKNEAIINYELLLTKYPEDRGRHLSIIACIVCTLIKIRLSLPSIKTGCLKSSLKHFTPR
ncbi:hypothetical protein [Mucilaginibacter antarcticus]|uniref:hypothetical protein n=1 Tax=Mucilaginibacter antarcticus TaxID=1855725 RepID=UPI0036296091